LPRRRYIFGLGQNLSTRSKNNEDNKLEIFIENFDPLINNIEKVRDELEINNKSIILINKLYLNRIEVIGIIYEIKVNKSLLTE